MSLFPGTHLEFSGVGAFSWSMFFFGVSASRVKSKRDIRLWYLFQCRRFQRPCADPVFRPVPLLSPAVASVGATSVSLRNVWRCLPRILLNSGIERERESFSLLVDWDDQQLLNAGLHLSRPRTVIFWYGGNRCQQLLLSAWLEVVVIYPVRF